MLGRVRFGVSTVLRFFGSAGEAGADLDDWVGAGDAVLTEGLVVDAVVMLFISLSHFRFVEYSIVVVVEVVPLGKV